MRPVDPTSARPAENPSACSVNVARVGHALFAGAGVRVTGINDDDLCRAFLHAFGADLYRGSANLICREHSSHRRGRFGNDKREVALLALVRAFAGAEFFDVAKHAAGEKAGGRNDGSANFFELRFHFQIY